ncbi:MAG: RNA polymerase sporulation sigma factor SigK [Bacilli bacterium]|nr:RNA polymerase sporulation sigma factor SigK [Bacilli bacterium]
MLFNILNFITSNLSFFTGSYSNNIFPDPLTKEEEDMYIEKMLNGDKEARNKLIEHNLRLVAHIVKKFETTNNDVDDLIGIGTVGLIKGIDTYSKNRNVKLTTYAAKCSENEILMHFRSDKKNIKNISIYDGISYDKEGNEITILDVLKTPDPDFLEEIHKNNNIELLKKYMNKLTPREKEILEKRYGLNGYDEVTQKEIAKELGISRSYVSRIEKRATTKILKEFIKNKNN